MGLQEVISSRGLHPHEWVSCSWNELVLWWMMLSATLWFSQKVLTGCDPWSCTAWPSNYAVCGPGIAVENSLKQEKHWPTSFFLHHAALKTVTDRVFHSHIPIIKATLDALQDSFLFHLLDTPFYPISVLLLVFFSTQATHIKSFWTVKGGRSKKS